jgi:hypothetical protein
MQRPLSQVLYFLSGLTCNDENFGGKAGAQRYAAQHGIALVLPDTSPRGHNVEGEKDSWDFGVGAALERRCCSLAACCVLRATLTRDAALRLRLSAAPRRGLLRERDAGEVEALAHV